MDFVPEKRKPGRPRKPPGTHWREVRAFLPQDLYDWLHARPLGTSATIREAVYRLREQEEGAPGAD